HDELVLCDLRSPPIPATELAAELAQRNETTRVILIGDEEDAPELVSALDCGAAGFFTRDASAEEFIEGVQAVVAGHFAIGGNLARRALARLSGREAASGGAYDRLSPAERTILSLLGQAHSTPSIPATLDQRLHRCIALASRFGAIRLRRPDSPDVREFLLDLDDSFGSRLRWTLKTVASGTELSISRPPGIARLTNLARRGSVADRQ